MLLQLPLKLLQKQNAVPKATVATVDAPEVKLKAASTVGPLPTNTAVSDKAVAGVKDTATLTVKVGTTSVEAKFDDSILEANQVNFDVAGAEANFKTEADDGFKSSVVVDQASVEAKFITTDGPEIKRLRNRILGAALNIWRDEYEQAFELSNLQLRTCSILLDLSYTGRGFPHVGGYHCPCASSV